MPYAQHRPQPGSERGGRGGRRRRAGRGLDDLFLGSASQGRDSGPRRARADRRETDSRRVGERESRGRLRARAQRRLGGQSGHWTSGRRRSRRYCLRIRSNPALDFQERMQVLQPAGKRVSSHPLTLTIDMTGVEQNRHPDRIGARRPAGSGPTA